MNQWTHITLEVCLHPMTATTITNSNMIHMNLYRKLLIFEHPPIPLHMHSTLNNGYVFFIVVWQIPLVCYNCIFVKYWLCIFAQYQKFVHPFKSYSWHSCFLLSFSRSGLIYFLFLLLYLSLMQAVPLSARKATGGSAEGIAPFLQLPHFSEAVIKKIARKVSR